MPANPNYRVPPTAIDADRESLLGIEDLQDYRPVNPIHTHEQLSARDQRLRKAEANEIRLTKLLAAARDETTEAGWEFHNAVMGAKAQVLAQYGDDSDEVAAVGLKKRSDRKRPSRRAKPEE